MEDGNIPPAPPTTKPERDHAASLEGEHDDPVHAAIVAAGASGLSLRELEDHTGLRNRVLQNVTWRLETRQHRVHRIPGTNPQRYAAGRSPAEP